MLSGVCDDQRNDVTVPFDFVFREDVVVLLKFYCSFGESERHEVVLAAKFLNVLSCNDLYYARHLLSFAVVDVQNLGVVGDSRHYHLDLQSLSRHVHLYVITVVAYAACLRQSVRSFERLAVEVADVLLPVIAEVFDSLFASHDCSRCHDSVDNLLVASTSADISVLREPVSDFFSCRIRIFLQELIGRNDESRYTVTALYGTAGYPH